MGELKSIKLEIGDEAPDFTVQTAEEKTVSLKDYAGKFLVLYFYPKDNTPGCTIEACDFSRLAADFAKVNTEILGISRDSLKSHAKFRDKYELNFALGADTEGDICSNYGVWVQKSFMGKKYMGINRSTFLIDKKGKIAGIWADVAVKGHAQEVLETVRYMKGIH